MMLLLLKFIDFKARSRYKFLIFLTARKETRPFAGHCKKDVLQSLRLFTIYHKFPEIPVGM